MATIVHAAAGLGPSFSGHSDRHGAGVSGCVAAVLVVILPWAWRFGCSACERSARVALSQRMWEGMAARDTSKLASLPAGMERNLQVCA